MPLQTLNSPTQTIEILSCLWGHKWKTWKGLKHFVWEKHNSVVFGIVLSLMTLSDEHSGLDTSNKASFIYTHPILTLIHIHLKPPRTINERGRCLKNWIKLINNLFVNNSVDYITPM